MKKILIINGHPDKNSYCSALATNYAEGAKKTGNEIDFINVYDLQFELNLHDGYKKKQEIEKDLILSQEKIKWSNHIVLVHPVWWGSIPALFKGFIDRVFLPGYGFKYRQNSELWDKLLAGRSARIIYTMDYPIWYYKLILGEPSVKQLKKLTLEFCGIKPVKSTAIGPIRPSGLSQREAWLRKVYLIGESGL